MASTYKERLKRFYSKYPLGSVVDIDGVYGFQCVDYIKAELRDVDGVKPGSFGNAIDYWYHTHKSILKKRDKVETKSPREGDIVVFETKRSPIVKGRQPGHVGIATGNETATKVEVREQNGHDGTGNGSGGNRIRTRYIVKSRIAGVLRSKPTKKPVFYRVVKNDTLGKLARRFKTTIPALAKLNRIKNVNLIRIGQKLRIK